MNSTDLYLIIICLGMGYLWSQQARLSKRVKSNEEKIETNYDTLNELTSD